jgi:translation initiation factor 4E
MNSQFDLIGIYANESGSIVKDKVINEFLDYKETYDNYISDYDEYIKNIKDDNFKGDIITLAAISQIYNFNIGFKSDKIIADNLYYVHILVDESRPVDIEIIYTNDVYKLPEHPLNTEWNMYISLKNKSDNWMDKIKHICEVKSIESFWEMFNNIPEASELVFPYDYYFFRKDIQPMWEDPLNKDGGKITIIIKKDYTDEEFNKLWLYTLLGCIGEQYDDVNMICGVVLNIRKHQSRINIWLNDSDKDRVEQVAAKWKELLELNKTQDISKPIEMSFLKHDDNDIHYKFI